MNDSGLLVVDKPAGLTSHDVVARVRRLCGTRKVGHAGTLDPMATGVLLLGVNKGTRLLGHLALAEKSYDATIRLGASTTTDDAEGEVLARHATDGVTDAGIATVLSWFLGKIDQVPSAVSAIKVDGKRAYARVRAGEEVVLPSRRVTIHSLTVGAIEHTEGFVDVAVSVHCSSGTYIRAIARDLGAGLGVGGHLTALRRTSTGVVGLDVAHSLEEMQASGVARLLSLAEAARLFFPVLDVDEAAAMEIGFGRRLSLKVPADGPVALIGPAGDLLALYRADGDGARPVAVFV